MFECQQWMQLCVRYKFLNQFCKQEINKFNHYYYYFILNIILIQFGRYEER